MNSGEGKSAGSNEDGGLGAELLAAAQAEDRGDEIIRILEADPTLIHVTDPVGDTTLHVVARAGNLEVAERVVARVKKHELTEVLLEQNLQGDTPLLVAIANRHEHVARLFLEAKFAAASVKNEAGVSPFELAQESGFILWSFGGEYKYLAGTADVELALVKSDLDQSCDSSSEDDDEDQKFDSKLYFRFYGAVLDGREDLVLEALREHPHLVSLRPCSRGTFLHAAAGVGQVGVLRLLVGHMTPDEAVSFILDQDNDNGETALHAALEQNHKEAARYLIQLAPKAAYQINKETALHCV